MGEERPRLASPSPHPVSEENHPVLDAFRTHGGWDNNASWNGFALPTRPGIPGAEGLPVHQVTRDVLEEARSPEHPVTRRDDAVRNAMLTVTEPLSSLDRRAHTPLRGNAM